jgi:hypothetical protein
MAGTLRQVRLGVLSLRAYSLRKRMPVRPPSELAQGKIDTIQVLHLIEVLFVHGTSSMSGKITSGPTIRRIESPVCVELSGI